MGDVLKANWRSVKLGEVAIERTERVDNPADSKFDRYVGSDDIDRLEGSLRRWRSSTEVTSAAKVFQPDDFLFVRRSLYASDFRERAARSDFAGVCSGDILPLRARPGVIEPGFLGAVLNHPRIWEYVVKHATGSITRRIKWRDLAEYEFPLPPLAEQRRVARLLEASTAFVEHLTALAREARVVQRAALDSLFALPDSAVPLSRLCADTITYGIVQAGPDVPTGVPYIRVTDMTAGDELSTNGMLRTSADIAKKYARSMVRTGDIVVALRGVAGRVMTVPAELDGANLTQGTARVRVSPEHNSTFVLWALRSTRGRREFRRFLRGWKGESLLEITLGDLREVSVPVPCRSTQDQIASAAADLNAAVAATDRRLAAALEIHRAILSSDVSGAA